MKASSFAESIVWHSNLSQWRDVISPELAQWISCPKSMTKRMTRYCQRVDIEVLTSRMAYPSVNEARLLGLGTRRAALIREIIMWCDQQPWLYGRTVAPIATIKAELPRLYRLGDKAIGKLLFRHRNMRRSAFVYSCIRPGQHLYHKALRGETPNAKWLWGRHSQFNLADKKLLLTEVFLPDMITQLGGHCA